MTRQAAAAASAQLLAPHVAQLLADADRSNEDHRTNDSRGSSTDRQARRIKLAADPRFTDARRRLRCSHCSTILTVDNVEADRIIPAASYKYPNVIPSCRSCNASRRNDLTYRPPRPFVDVRRILSAVLPKDA